jgi:leucine dehydrogenase
MNIVELEYEGRSQRVVRIDDHASGARGYIVVDSTTLGPAMGGCRFWHYESDDAALIDAQRLARGMSLKNAMAGLPLGGGKSVLQMPTGNFDRTAVLTAFGHAVNVFAGDYLTAEDVGTGENDMRVVRSASPFVLGLPVDSGKAGGNPSPWTALGVFNAIRALAERSGRDLSTSTIAVQGLGQVGFALCELLKEAGASLIVADVNQTRMEMAEARGWKISEVRDIHRASADVFAPCALGGALNATTIAELGAPIVVGAANNQLATTEDAQRLLDRHILYAPDYVVNAGGVISVAAEYFIEDEAEVRARVGAISGRIVAIVEQAETEGVSPALVADRMALARIAEAETAPGYRTARAS